MDIVSLREFARRVGVSLTAVQKGAKPEVGRIQAIRDESGKITGIDADTQVAAWSENSKAPQRKPHNLAGGRPRLDGKPVAAPKAQASKLQEGEVDEFREPQPHGGALKRSKKEPAPDGEMSMAAVQRAREIVKLQTDNLVLKEKQGVLVNAKEQHRVGFTLGQTLISNLYNMPERLADEFAAMSDPAGIHTMWVAELDLSIAKIREAYGC